ncbi:ATP-binding cassette sub- G member 2 [Bulinus truncatus]|nr:ATP-binding cassette sub- G member 2 [Bulinus truncatus]
MATNSLTRIQMETIASMDKLLNHLDSTTNEIKNQHVIDNCNSAEGQSESVKARSERISSDAHGSSVLSFHDINYQVDVKVSVCRRKTQKQILNNVSGIFRPGMNAILGPTGSGKSSLLDVLAGRKDPNGLSGTLLLDGSPTPDNFKCLVGYVVQDDIVMGTLTVRENFEFSATLRLPSSVKKQERKERIDQIIYELGLTEVADSKVGTDYIRGISGGEKKRCSIGMELIISPPVLFLDEPTTGLDASTANAVMLLLKKLAENGRNIIFSIHQPRYSIYRLFDSLMLLSHGNVAYHGKASEALDYFASIGYLCEEHNNPSDFFLDVINGDSTAVLSLKKGVNGTIDENATKDVVVTIEETSSTSSLPVLFLDSIWHKAVQNDLDPIMDAHLKDVSSGAEVRIKKVEYKTSFGVQLLTVSKRCVKNIVRNPQVSIMQFKSIAVYALIIGGIYFQMSKSKDSGIQNRVGAFFFIIMNQVFGNMSAVELFIKERAVFIHENVSGYYRVSAYFLAKVFCDVIPLRMVPVIIFSCIVYFMLGLRDGVDHFFFFMFNLFLTAMSASSLCFAISSSVRILGLGNLFLAMCYVFMMLFGGLLINVGDLGDWISWVKYLSIFRYSLTALEINELKGQSFCNVTDCTFGDDYLQKQQISYDTQWDLWQNEVALVIMAAAFLLLAYVQLRRIQKLK